MKKKFILIGLLVALILAFTILLVGCDFSSGRGHKPVSISFSLPERGEVDTDVIITSSHSNGASVNPYYMRFEVVGENSCNVKFSILSSTKNVMKAELPGTVTIKGAYYVDGEFVTECGTASIEFYANPVSTVEELKAIAGSNKTYMLSNDIDLSGESKWTPIENFTGKLYGNGYFIKNFKAEVRSGDNIGLFGELNGIVKNLKMENVNISGSGSGNNVGAVAGMNSGTIENCEVSGNINCEYATCVGGIVGYSNVNLFDNVNNATVSAYENVGGVAGGIMLKLRKDEDKNTLVGGGNVNNGKISGTTSIGGVFGSVQCLNPNTSGVTYTGTYHVALKDSTNNGEVSATANNAGGIVGNLSGRNTSTYHAYARISDCENNGVVSGKDYVGGIYGYGGTVDEATACINTVDITGENYVGGFIGSSSGTEVSNMVNNNKITGKGYLGGIAGYAGNVKNCKNHGQIISTGTILEDDTNKYCVGGVVGYCEGLVGCENAADISVTLEGRRVGGIAGEIYCTNSIENCSNTGNVNAPNCNSVGGIAGRVSFKKTRTVKSNINEGAITGSQYCGGILGYAECINPSTSTSHETGTDSVTIGDCDNKGVITATQDYAGGIAGALIGYKGSVYSSYASISSNNNYASVTAPNYFGAIAGHANAYVNVNNEVLWPSNKDYGEVGKLYTA